MAMKPDTISLRRVIKEKRLIDKLGKTFNVRRAYLHDLIGNGFTWSRTPEGVRFWERLFEATYRKRFRRRPDIVLQNKSWR